MNSCTHAHTTRSTGMPVHETGKTNSIAAQLDTHVRSHDKSKVVVILKKVFTDFSLKKIT